MPNIPSMRNASLLAGLRDSSKMPVPMPSSPSLDDQIQNDFQDYMSNEPRFGHAPDGEINRHYQWPTPSPFNVRGSVTRLEAGRQR